MGNGRQSQRGLPGTHGLRSSPRPSGQALSREKCKPAPWTRAVRLEKSNPQAPPRVERLAMSGEHGGETGNPGRVIRSTDARAMERRCCGPGSGCSAKLGTRCLTDRNLPASGRLILDNLMSRLLCGAQCAWEQGQRRSVCQLPASLRPGRLQDSWRAFVQGLLRGLSFVSSCPWGALRWGQTGVLFA